MKKKSNIFKIIVFFTIICFSLIGCTTDDWAVVANSLSAANNSFANSYSSSNETGMVYTIYNRSSETVTLYDSTGTISIRPNSSASARFNNTATIYDVVYSPVYLNVTQSGYNFTFTD